MPISRGVRISVEATGSGPALLLLHGIGGGRRQWRGPRGGLPADLAVVAWDARGYGDSEGPPVARFADFAEDLLRLMDALGLDRALAAGHSMGGRVLIEAAALAPDRFAALVLTGAQPAYLAHCDEAGRRAYVAAREAMFEGGAVSRAAAERVAAEVLAPGASEAARRETIEGFLRLRRDGFLAALRASLGWDRRGAAARLAMPATVVGGALDPVCPPAETRALAHAIGQGPPVLLEGVGHMIHLEAPDRLASILTDVAARHATAADRLDAEAVGA